MKLTALTLAGCIQRSGVYVMFAGSLQKEMEDLIVPEFTEKTGIPVDAEARGSVTIVNLVKEGYKKPDVIISADATLLDELKPHFIDRYVLFASNSIVLAHNGMDIDKDNWLDALLTKKFKFGISEPESDPLGYRSLILLKLAEIYYNLKIYKRALENLIVFGLETDLVANIKTGTVDAGFIYKNMAISHGLEFIELPEEINLGSYEYRDFYSRAVVIVGDKVKRGEPIIYGMAKTKWGNKYGEKFVEFMLDDGIRLLKQSGLDTMVGWV